MKGTDIKLTFETKFNSFYLRNNRSTGQKSLRCFPQCSVSKGHRDSGFCGQSVNVIARIPKITQNSINWDKFLALAGLHTSETSGLRIGDKFEKSSLLKQVKLDTSSSGGKYDYLYGNISVLHENDKFVELRIIYNAKLRSWDYDWYSNRWKGDEKHVVQVYLLIENELNIYEVIATNISPEFQITSNKTFSIRSKSSSTILNDKVVKNRVISDTFAHSSSVHPMNSYDDNFDNDVISPPPILTDDLQTIRNYDNMSSYINDLSPHTWLHSSSHIPFLTSLNTTSSINSPATSSHIPVHTNASISDPLHYSYDKLMHTSSSTTASKNSKISHSSTYHTSPSPLHPPPFTHPHSVSYMDGPPERPPHHPLHTLSSTLSSPYLSYYSKRLIPPLSAPIFPPWHLPGVVVTKDSTKSESYYPGIASSQQYLRSLKDEYNYIIPMTESYNYPNKQKHQTATFPPHSTSTFIREDIYNRHQPLIYEHHPSNHDLLHVDNIQRSHLKERVDSNEDLSKSNQLVSKISVEKNENTDRYNNPNRNHHEAYSHSHIHSHSHIPSHSHIHSHSHNEMNNQKRLQNDEKYQSDNMNYRIRDTSSLIKKQKLDNIMNDTVDATHNMTDDDNDMNGDKKTIVVVPEYTKTDFLNKNNNEILPKCTHLSPSNQNIKKDCLESTLIHNYVIEMNTPKIHDIPYEKMITKSVYTPTPETDPMIYMDKQFLYDIGQALVSLKHSVNGDKYCHENIVNPTLYIHDINKWLSDNGNNTTTTIHEKDIISTSDYTGISGDDICTIDTPDSHDDHVNVNINITTTTTLTTTMTEIPNDI